MTENLATVVKCMTDANKAFLKVIEKGADQVGQLEKFEDKFQGISSKFEFFKEKVEKNEKQADELYVRLNQQLNSHKQYLMTLQEDISRLKATVESVSIEEENLKHELTEAVELHTKLKADRSSSNISNIGSPSPGLLRRLQDEYK